MSLKSFSHQFPQFILPPYPLPSPLPSAPTTPSSLPSTATLLRLLLVWVNVRGCPGPVLLDVGLKVEVEEEQKEHCAVEEDDEAESFGEVTLDEEREGGVQEEGDELYQLQGSQVPAKTKMVIECKKVGNREMID